MIAPIRPAVERLVAPIRADVQRRLLVTTAEAAELLSCSEKTVTRLVARKEIPAVKLGPRAVRVSVDSIREFIARQQNTFSKAEG